MNKTNQGSIAQKRGAKLRSFLRGAHSNLFRTILQLRIKALVSSQRDRDQKKRDYRSLWINRINAIIRINKEKIYYSYSKLINNLYKNQLLLNRKILAQIARLKGNCLFMIANDII
uniref:50S ribosomal protein L20 n=1 Tax=Vicia costata TaxID=1276815 RepID=A0A8A0WT58_9FABA|nr:ribosomal protein L20 [Vicia costata]QSQ72506.1 ribosomal protein L20 [Vicia costata]